MKAPVTENRIVMKNVPCSNVITGFFWPGKALLQNLGNSLVAGKVPDLLQGIILRDVNSRQNLGSTITFKSKNITNAG